MEQFINKVVLITGSSAGIGAGIARYLASRGATLSLTGRSNDKLNTVKHECVKAGLKPDQVLTQAGDLTCDTFRSELISRTEKTFGQLDVLVNNAGMAKIGPLSAAALGQYESVMSLNLHSVVALTQLAVPMLQTTKGNIVNISSNVGLRPAVGLGAYCMSKAALDMFTRVLALELAPKGIRVNSVNPGYVQTDIYRHLDMDVQQYSEFLKERARTIPVGKIGEPEDVARAVAFLASGDSSFITGELMVVDGGARFAQVDVE